MCHGPQLVNARYDEMEAVDTIAEEGAEGVAVPGDLRTREQWPWCITSARNHSSHKVHPARWANQDRLGQRPTDAPYRGFFLHIDQY